MNLKTPVIDEAVLHKLNEILNLLKEIYKTQNANKYIEDLEKRNKELNELNNKLLDKTDLVQGVESVIFGSDVK